MSLLLVFAVLASSGWAKTKASKSYGSLILRPLEVPAGTDFPADFERSLAKNLVKHLQDTGRFSSVTISEPGASDKPAADVVMTGQITRFVKGSRGNRYLVPGMGATRIRALVVFTESATGKKLYEKEVKGSVSFGLFGGDSLGATNGLAKDVAKGVKASLP
jgi:hypothetical protein